MFVADAVRTKKKTGANSSRLHVVTYTPGRFGCRFKKFAEEMKAHIDREQITKVEAEMLQQQQLKRVRQ